MADFFISYNKADREWAAWIAWTLEEAGYTVLIQAWDFRPGSNFVLDMQQALQTSNRTIAVLSEDYLKSAFTAPEWAAVFAEDSEARHRKLIPVMVRPCTPKGLLGPLVYVNLIGLTEDSAKAALLGAFSERAKPTTAPAFPGQARAASASFAAPPFPGPSGIQNTHEIASPPPSLPPSPPSRKDRLNLIKQLNALPPGQFNILLFALNPPPGLVSPMPAPQAQRSADLLGWAESSPECGLAGVEEVLKATLNPR